MSTELRTRMVLDLAGNYADMMKGFEKATQRFVQGTHTSLGVAQRAWGVFGAKLDGAGNNFYARVAGAGGLALAARQVAGFDESLTRIGINANASAARVNALKQQIMDVANRPDIKVKIDDLAAGVGAIVERTGDLDFASKNMANLGHFMQATGENAEDIGELIGNIRTFGVEAPQDINKVVDSWLEMGKKSGLSLKEMISRGQEVLALYQQMGRKGPEALREVGGLMAMATKQLGSPRLATAASTELLQTLRQNLAVTMGLGITDMSGHMKMPLDQALQKIIETYHGYTPALQKIFGQQGETLLTPMLNEYNAGKPMDALKQYIDVTADGTSVIDDSTRAAREADESVNTLSNSWEKFANKDLSKPLKDLSDDIDKLNPDTVQKTLKGLEYAGGGLLAIYGARKLGGGVTSAIRTGKYIFGGGKGAGGMLGELGELGEMAGVQRVFVVNMPGGGATWGGGEPNWGGASGASKLATAARWGAGITVAGAAGYGIGSAIYAATDDTKFMDHVGSAVAHFMSLFDDTAKQAIQQRNAADATVAAGRDANINMKLSFDAQGNPVLKHVQSDTHKLNLEFNYLGRAGIAGAQF